jgi:hypothetical protein
MSLFNIEILVAASKNIREQNDDWRREVFREGRERAIRVNELLAMFEAEYAFLDQEASRLQQYLPRKAEEQFPKAEQLPKVQGSNK